jgi:hypothetical protein
MKRPTLAEIADNLLAALDETARTDASTVLASAGPPGVLVARLVRRSKGNAERKRPRAAGTAVGMVRTSGKERTCEMWR